MIYIGLINKDENELTLPQKLRYPHTHLSFDAMFVISLAGADFQV